AAAVSHLPTFPTAGLGDISQSNVGSHHYCRRILWSGVLSKRILVHPLICLVDPSAALFRKMIPHTGQLTPLKPQTTRFSLERCAIWIGVHIHADRSKKIIDCIQSKLCTRLSAVDYYDAVHWLNDSRGYHPHCLRCY